MTPEIPRIAVIGSSNVDFIMRLERLPAVGESTTDGEFSQTFGGKGANQAVAAARAGGGVTFVTCLGDDPFAETMIGNFRRDGIDTARIARTAGVSSGSALVLFDARGDNYIGVAPGSNYRLRPEHIDACEDLIAGAAFLLLQMEISVESNRRALELAARHRTPVLFNFAPARDPRFPVSSAMTGLVVNETEAEALTGLPVRDPGEARAAAEALRRRGPAFVVVTLGRGGAWVSAEGSAELVPGFAVEPVDSTAAGDTFCGALAVALAEKKPLGAAVRFANAAAALSVTRAGAQPSIPGRARIDAFLAGREEGRS